MACCEEEPLKVQTTIKNNILFVKVGDESDKVLLPTTDVSDIASKTIYQVISVTEGQTLLPNAIPANKTIDTLTINGLHYYNNIDFIISGGSISWTNTLFQLQPSFQVILWLIDRGNSFSEA